LFKHWISCALFFADDKTGSNIAAKMAMTAMTTSNSINVNARLVFIFASSVRRQKIANQF
jgi:hypothetical protein